MIEVVIVDDLEYFRNIIKEILIIELKKRNIKSKIFCFDKYNKDFWKHVKSTNNYKLFILDIEVPGMSGIDASRKIRVFDLKSDILFVTAYDNIKNKNLILFSTIRPLSFLNKKNIKIDLQNKLDYIANFFPLEKENQKTLTFKNKLETYKIYENDIDFIEVNKINHNLIIHLTNSIIEINQTIKEFEKIIDATIFFKTHRSCIINIKNVKKINYKNNRITFYSENITELLSRHKKKELKDKIKNK